MLQEIQLSEVGSLLARIMQGSYTSIFNTHKKKYENGAATFDVRSGNKAVESGHMIMNRFNIDTSMVFFK